jgi:flagellar hook-associated protein 3 FlgL
MKLHGSSELSRMQLLQRQAVEVRAALDRAAQEATTGLKVDKYKATGGNLARLFTIERMLERNAVYRETISVTEMRLDVMQDGLGRALGWAEQVSVDLLTATNLGDYAGATLHAQTAQRAFLDTVSMLNTRLAGQMLFAGIATDRPALAEGAAMLAQIEGIVAGAPDAATAEALIEDYFAGIGAPNFRDDGYLGALEDLAGAEIADGVRLDYAVRADAGELVAALKGHAMAAMVARGALAGAPAEEMALLGAAGRALLASREGLLELRARVGVSQNTVEIAQAERRAEYETYDMARAKIIGADAFVAASAFQAMQAQLESVFTVTARLSTLRFANFIR